MKWHLYGKRREPNPNGKVRLVSHILNSAQIAQLWGKPKSVAERQTVQVSHEVERGEYGKRERKTTVIVSERVVNW